MNNDLSHLDLRQPRDLNDAIIEGKGGYRLRINSDPRLDSIAATWRNEMSLFQKIKDKILKNVVYIPVNDPSTGEVKELAVNINSFTKRFKLTKVEAKRILESPQAFNKLSEVVGDLVRAINTQITIVDANVQVIIRRVLSNIQDYIRENLDTPLDLNDRSFRIVQNAEGLSVLKLGKKLGAGSFGEVFAVQDLVTSEKAREVFKVAKKQDDVTVEHEYQVLQKLNPDGSISGVQRPPRKCISLGVRSETNRPGYLAPRYQGSLTTNSHKLLGKNQPEKAIYQLCHGLLHVHQEGYYHGDIKPDNILVDQSRYDLADLGGIQRFDSIAKSFESYAKADYPPAHLEATMDKIWGVCTRNYINEEDVDQLQKTLEVFAKRFQQASTEGDRSRIKQQASEAICLIMKARDAYALGMSLIKTLPLDIFDNIIGIDPKHQREVADCLEQMKDSPSQCLSAETCYKDRLKAMNRLHELFSNQDNSDPS